MNIRKSRKMSNTKQGASDQETYEKRANLKYTRPEERKSNNIQL